MRIHKQMRGFVGMVLALGASLTSVLAADHVCDIDISRAPDMKEFSETARDLADKEYPKILKLMAEDAATLPQHFDIIFRHRQRDPGLTAGTKVYLSAEWFTRHPDDLGAIVHEMAHVAQRYVGGAPGYWVEGIADYVRYTLGYTNSWSYPHCSAEFPHFKDGYWCTSAFLMYLDAAHGSNVVRRFNAALGRPGYSDEFFVKATGKSLDELWVDFQKTAAYQPSALKEQELREVRDQKERAECAGHLKSIQKAILTYQHDKHKMPGWLSDLVPDYISDTNVLICPITQRTGRTENFGMADPKMPKAYLYEFNAGKLPWGGASETSHSMQEFKEAQKNLIGEGIPVLRCHLHSPVLNVSYSGKVFESGTSWESMFTNVVVTMEDLSAYRLFSGRKE